MRKYLTAVYRNIVKVLLPAGLAVVMVILYLLGAFGPLQHGLNDVQFRWRPARGPSDKIVIIAIDPESEHRLGVPFERWKRVWTAKVVASLAEAGAEIIALDFRYAKRPDARQDDDALADAIVAAENVVLAAFVERGQLLRSDEKFLDGAIGEGHLNVKEDEDGVLRRIRYAKISGQELPYAAEPVPFMLYFDLTVVRALKYIEDVELEGDRLTLVEKDEDGRRIGEYTITIGNHPINYVGHAGSFTRIPFWKVFESEFRPEQVKGKVCLVGDTRLRGGDFFTTPHSAYYRPTPESDPILRAMPGVEVHANGIQTILERTTIHESTTGAGVTFILIFGLGIGMLFFFLQRGGIILPAVVVAVALALILLLSYKLFAACDYQMASIPCLLVVVAQFTAGMSYRWLAARAWARRIQEMFGRYVSANVVSKMISGELSVNLEGHTKEITVSFMDIRNFTETCEQLSAGQISRLLNQFFSRMIGVIFSVEGTLDKLMGDCIMWFFNDPQVQPDHPQRAARAALRMLEEIERFKKESDLPGAAQVEIGIGVSTGEATVGNLGAPEFHDYTAIGDTVNLGSRLEGLNKEYSTRLIISEATHERIRGEFFCRELDLVRVKGREAPVRIYELIGAKDQLSEGHKQLTAGFQRALELYRGRQFEKAREAFEQLSAQFLDDGPCRVYARRCRILAENPPKEEWSGIFTFTTK